MPDNYFPEYMIAEIAPDNIRGSFDSIPKLNANPQNIAKITFFIPTDNNAPDYRSELTEIYSDSPDIREIPFTIVEQKPLGTSAIIAEIMLCPEVNIISSAQRNYSKARCGQIEMLISPDFGKQLAKSSLRETYENGFHNLEKFLQTTDMNYADIIRQWNYIGNIVGIEQAGSAKVQHYQIFNDVRSLHYSAADWSLGYPAATGIGALGNGLAMDVIVCKSNRDIRIAPIANPMQTNAHQYSGSVLIGKETGVLEQKSTPKFERAKIINSRDMGIVFVSGTAAIRGEETLSVGDAAGQTQITLENIEKLVSDKSIENATGHKPKAHSEILSARVYIKNENDYEAVRKKCEQRLKKKQIIYLKADICRPDLLVEIEAVFAVRF